MVQTMNVALQKPWTAEEFLAWAGHQGGTIDGKFLLELPQFRLSSDEHS